MIEDAAWENIDVIKDKNKQDLALIINAGIKSKSELIEKQSEFKDFKASKDQLKNDTIELQTKLNELISLYNELK